jgi:hypothetical protein
VRTEAEIRDLLAASRTAIHAHMFCKDCEGDVENSLLDVEHTLLWVLGEPTEAGEAVTAPLSFGLTPDEVVCVLNHCDADAAVLRAVQQ